MRDRVEAHQVVLHSDANPAHGTLAVRPPISGYAPHPEESIWLLVLGIAALVYLGALTLIR
jgi:hypothetical protein